MSRQIIQYMLTFGGATIISIYYALYSEQISIIYMFLLLAAALHLAFISSTLIVVNDSLHNFQDFITDFRREINICLRELVVWLHRPNAELIRMTDDLVVMIAKAIRDATDDVKDPHSMTFLGAVSLQTPAEGSSEAVTSSIYEDEEGQTPHQIYQGALEEATSRRASIIRFVALPPVEEILERSRNVQQDYSRWLRNQISQLSRNENYLLIDSPRTPKWGASGARIIAGENIFDITYKNGVALHLKDKRMAINQAEKMELSALAGDPSNVTVYSKNPSDLKRVAPDANHQGLQKLEDDLKEINEHLKY